jgi:hypothetical protein
MHALLFRFRKDMNQNQYAHNTKGIIQGMDVHSEIIPAR